MSNSGNVWFQFQFWFHGTCRNRIKGVARPKLGGHEFSEVRGTRSCIRVYGSGALEDLHCESFNLDSESWLLCCNNADRSQLYLREPVIEHGDSGKLNVFRAKWYRQLRALCSEQTHRANIIRHAKPNLQDLILIHIPSVNSHYSSLLSAIYFLRGKFPICWDNILHVQDLE